MHNALASVSYLKGVVNILADLQYGHNVRLIVFSFGQTHLVTVRDKIRNGPDKGRDLLKRFFNRLLVLPGVGSAKELEYVFLQLDDFRLNEYPEQSGISYSRFFMPLAFAAGWRLAPEAKNLWRAFATAMPDLTTVGMGYVVQALRTFFETCATRDAAGFTSNRRDWKAAVDECGFGSDDDN